MKVYETLNLYAKDLVIGKHGIWWPSEGIKVPFQWGGKIQKYQKPLEGRYSLDLLLEEVGMLKWLAAIKLAPPIGEFVYFKTVISEHLGGYWADPCGAYGYRMADANGLPPGGLVDNHIRPISEQLKQYCGNFISGSPGAWNDLNKDGNTVNHYLIDARRSGWDRLRWSGPVPNFSLYHEDIEQLHLDIKRDGQFPFKERSQPYQEYYLAGQWHKAERDVLKRAELFDFPYAALPSDTVLDLGTQCGGFLQFASQVLGNQGGKLIGIDSNPAYIELAQRLARANGQNICYRVMSIEDLETIQVWLETLRWPKINHLLMLSMLKHLKDGEATLWHVLDSLKIGYAYIESNATKPDLWPLRAGAELRGGAYVGDSLDRNLRRCYRVPGK